MPQVSPYFLVQHHRCSRKPKGALEIYGGSRNIEGFHSASSLLKEHAMILSICLARRLPCGLPSLTCDFVDYTLLHLSRLFPAALLHPFTSVRHHPAAFLPHFESSTMVPASLRR